MSTQLYIQFQPTTLTLSPLPYGNLHQVMLILQRYVHGRVQSVPCLEQQHQLGRPHIDNSQVYETSHATTTTMMTTTTRATLVKN